MYIVNNRTKDPNSGRTMSVLDNIVCENGRWIRNLTSFCSHMDFVPVCEALSRVSYFRLDDATYRQDADELPSDVKNVVASHWIDDDNNVCHGLPQGSFNDFLKRVINNKLICYKGRYEPTQERTTDEVTSRDLLLCSGLFDFRDHSRDSAFIVKSLMIPLLNRVRDNYQGSYAVFRLIDHINKKTKFAEALGKIYNEEKTMEEFHDFCANMNALAVAISPNTGDWRSALKSTSQMTMNQDESPFRYKVLSDLANDGIFVERSMGVRGTLKKRVDSLAHKYTKAMREYEECKNPRVANSYLREATDITDRLLREMISPAASCKTVYHKGKESSIRMVAVKGCVFIVNVIDRELYIFSDEDLKNLKFAGMSHTLWHLYAGTIGMEYYGPDIPNFFKRSKGELSDVANQIKAHMEDIAAKVLSMKMTKQQRVDLSTVKVGLAYLWDLYGRVISRSLDNKCADYVGRYLSKMFAAAMSKYGGKMMRDQQAFQRDEFIGKWSRYGFNANEDLDSMIAIFSMIPMTSIQDFGRLGKIVPAYNINSACAFLDRACAMKSPNPYGNAQMTSSLTYDVEPEEDKEFESTKDIFRAAARIMITVSDMRTMYSSRLSVEESTELSDLEWLDKFKRIVDSGLRLDTNVTLLDNPDIPCPNPSDARDQAKELLDSGTMPTNPWAGCFLNTKGILRYRKRDSTDIGYMKSSSMPPSDIKTALSIPKSRGTTHNLKAHAGKKNGKPTSMIESLLADEYPNRREAMSKIKEKLYLLMASCKIETDKSPDKTRIIVSAEADGRRVQTESEFNIGLDCKNVPGFTVGVDPLVSKKKIYMSIANKDSYNMKTLRVSLDLTAFSTGMRAWIQKLANSCFEEFYGDSCDVYGDLFNITQNSLMCMNTSGYVLAMRNSKGSNYEGLDGKRNTFIHCVLWYLARCEAGRNGVQGHMRPFLFIDDAMGLMEVPKINAKRIAEEYMKAIISIYAKYGFILDVPKTVVSVVYGQFLNEVYYMSMHIAYGFRALCHTGAKPFPDLSTMKEEIDVIAGGIRGSAMAGGNAIRVYIGYCILIFFYMRNVIGTYGRTLRSLSGLQLCCMLQLPTIAGGMGCAGYLSLFSNFAGHHQIEALDATRNVLRFCRQIRAPFHDSLAQYVKHNMMNGANMLPDSKLDRIAVKVKALNRITPGNRDEVILDGAIAKAVNSEVKRLMVDYKGSGRVESAHSLGLATRKAIAGIRIPFVTATEIVSSDPVSAVGNLINKIASSYYIDRFMSRKDKRDFARRYFVDAKRWSTTAVAVF